MSVFLLVGLPASGKTWVAEQLGWSYVPNDSFIGREPSLIQAVAQLAARAIASPVITDCPFGERTRKEALEARRIKVSPVFILESVDELWRRYITRKHKPLKRDYFVSRAPGLKARAIEWRAPHGTAKEILSLLKGMR